MKNSTPFGLQATGGKLKDWSVTALTTMINLVSSRFSRFDLVSKRGILFHSKISVAF